MMLLLLLMLAKINITASVIEHEMQRHLITNR